MAEPAQITVSGTDRAVVEGDHVRIRGHFEDLQREQIDPTVVTVLWKPPAEPFVTKVFGVDGEVKKADAGDYYIDVDVTPGTWFFRWEADGDFRGAAESELTVEDSRVV